MRNIRIAVVGVLALVSALPAFGKTYKTTYPVACGQVWSAVKDTLSNPENYSVAETQDALMTAKYDVKHSAHVNISGAALQRQNKVTLVSEGTGCQMQVVSNYSGWEHNDQGEFKRRVEEAMAKAKTAPAAAATEPAAAAAAAK
jgi:hypothetical protein